MHRIYQPLLQEFGPTYPQFIAMVSLWENDNQTVGALSRAMALESSTLTPLLKRLEAAGLIKRTRSAEDERRVIVSLTEKGCALDAKTRHIPQCILSASGLGLDEIAQLQSKIQSLRRSMERG